MCSRTSHHTHRAEERIYYIISRRPTQNRFLIRVGHTHVCGAGLQQTSLQTSYSLQDECRADLTQRPVGHAMNAAPCANDRTLAAVLARSRNHLSLPNEYESSDAAKFYFKRNLPERQSRIKASGLWKPHDSPSAAKVVVSEVQSPLYKMVLMKARFDIDVPGGHKAPFVISVTTTNQMQQLSADGWTRVVHSSYSANTEIPKSIRTGDDFVKNSVAADVLRDLQIMVVHLFSWQEKS